MQRGGAPWFSPPCVPRRDDRASPLFVRLCALPLSAPLRSVAWRLGEFGATRPCATPCFAARASVPVIRRATRAGADAACACVVPRR